MYKDESKKFDIRIVDKYMQDGTITPEEHARHLESLPDVSSSIDNDYEVTLASAHRKGKARASLRKTDEATIAKEDATNFSPSEVEPSDD